MNNNNLLGLTLLCTSGLLFSQAVYSAASQPSSPALVLAPTPAQQMTVRQVANIVDTQHYLQQSIDPAMSAKILTLYLDSMDPDHILFLQDDIDRFKTRYGATIGTSLKQGDLEPALDIFNVFLQRSGQYLDYVDQLLANPPSLKSDEVYNTDRENKPYFATTSDQQKYWNQHLRAQLIALTLSKQEEQAKIRAAQENPSLTRGQPIPTNNLTALETLKKRFVRQREQLGRIKIDRVLESALNATLGAYDPHSNYFAPQEAAEMNRQTTLQLEGIGVSIRPERGNEDYTRIETIIDGGPASKSGLVRAGDRILAVGQDGEPMVDVVGWTTSEIVGQIRGKRGTRINLKLQNAAGDVTPRTVTLVRDIIKDEEDGVRSRIINIPRNGRDYRIGVLEVPSFYLDYRGRRDGSNYRSVANDTAQALTRLGQQKVDGLVVDLRNNPGGSLEDVVRMLSMFIKDGPLVQIRDGNGQVYAFYDQDQGAQLYAGPMTVLINNGSASASEIFSAAIQDYDRGIVLGTPTLGKGTAQVQKDDLPYGQMTLTQRKFYRVTGGSTQNRGVLPDITLPNIYAEEFGERKAKNALVWDTIPTAPYRREFDIGGIRKLLEKRSVERQQRNPQFNYVSKVTAINKAMIDKKNIKLDLDIRKTELKTIDDQLLQAENTRRKAAGLPLYQSFQAFQAARETESEERARLKKSQRKPLPEDEAYITEGANVLVDWIEAQPQVTRVQATTSPLTGQAIRLRKLK